MGPLGKGGTFQPRCGRKKVRHPNGGGGEIFVKIKMLFLFFFVFFLFLALPLQDFGNAGTFHQNLFYP